MKKFSMLFVVIIVMFISGCGRIIPGEEGFLVNNWGDEKGEIENLSVGLHFFNPFKYDLRTYPMQLQNISWENEDPEAGAFSWNDKEGMVFMSDIGVSYRVNPGSSSKIFMKYRKGLDEVTNIDLKNKLQDAFVISGSKRASQEIYGEGKTDFIEEVQMLLQKEFEGLLIIEKVSFKSEMVLPREVQRGIEAQITAIQKARQRENEIAEATAEKLKQKEVADADAYTITAKADAEAYSIKVVQEQLSKSPQYIEYLKAQKWDGILPVYTSGVPMIKIAPEVKN